VINGKVKIKQHLSIYRTNLTSSVTAKYHYRIFAAARRSNKYQPTISFAFK